MSGTSTGARKGWLTRRGYARFGGSAIHTRKQELLTVEESARLRKMRGGKAAPKRQAMPAPVPIRRDLPYRDIDVYSPPDPDYLIQAYGHHQLGRVLQDYSMDMLRGTARNVQAKHPGTKPASMSSRQALVDYIVRYSTAQAAPAPRATRPAPAAPAPSPSRQDKRAETLRREIAEHEAVVRAFNEKHPGGQINARDREQRLELQRVSKHYADAIHKRELLEGRPAPAAPAKSSKPVAGKRVKMEKPAAQGGTVTQQTKGKLHVMWNNRRYEPQLKADQYEGDVARMARGDPRRRTAQRLAEIYRDITRETTKNELLSRRLGDPQAAAEYAEHERRYHELIAEAKRLEGQI